MEEATEASVSQIGAGEPSQTLQPTPLTIPMIKKTMYYLRNTSLPQLIKKGQVGMEHSERQQLTMHTGSLHERCPCMLHTQAMYTKLVCVATHNESWAGRHTLLKFLRTHHIYVCFLLYRQNQIDRQFHKTERLLENRR